MVVVTARGTGFHTLSPLGELLSPNIFLNSPLNPGGTVVGSPASGWETTDSALREDYVVRASGATFTQSGPFTGTLTVREITYLRVENGAEVVVGTAKLEPPVTLALQATRDAAGLITGWSGDLGTALLDLVQAEGFSFRGGAGADVFIPIGHILPIYDGVTIHGRGGDDILHGGRQNDEIRGGRGDDLLYDPGGADWLHGGAGADRIILGAYSDGSVARGGRGDDWISSSNGSDRLIGNAGDDRLDGGRGADTLRGGLGGDRLNGGEGRDRLSGGIGDDLLTGGWGADSFVFRKHQAGHDTVTDFDLAAGDRLVLRGLSAEDITLTRDGDDTVLSWNDGASTLRLEDVTLDNLNDTDVFLF